MRKSQIKHKSDYESSGGWWWSTRCGLTLHVAKNGKPRIAKTWRGTTCKNCLRCGKRGKLT